MIGHGLRLSASIAAVIASAVLSQASAWGQNCATPGQQGAGTNITGVVNTYHPGIDGTTLAPGETSIPVGPARAGGGQAIIPGDLLLVIQMQDADINAADTDAYGNGTPGGAASGITAPNSTGLYEYVMATGPLAGGVIPIQGLGPTNGLVNAYRNAAATGTAGQRRYQVIRVPQYTSATLGAGLTALPWDGATGGVVAIDVSGALDLNGGTVTASNLGFRGGSGQGLTGVGGATPNDHFRTPTSDDYNGNKGEGIAGTPRFVANQFGIEVDTGSDGYPNGSRARGAPGNAGGGGNTADPNQNDSSSGGGGGANGGSGGQGGDTGDDGAVADANLPRGGHGGAAFASVPGRVVMGAGGGSGVKDIAFPIISAGGGGGGIIMIRTDTVTGTGTIRADGGNGQNGGTLAMLAAGGGGGGGGGTVVLIALGGGGAWTGATVTANGGAGGNGNTATATGPGGGGGGGAVFHSGPSIGATVTGGAAGTTVAASTRNAAAGSAGTTSTGVLQNQIPGLDGGAECGTNQAPVAVADAYSVGTGGTLSPAAPGVLGNDTDADGDPLTAVLDTSPTNGTLTLNPNGSFTYVHDGGGSTTDSFTYHANDGVADSNTVTVTITITTNVAPVADDDAYTTPEDTPRIEPSATGVLDGDTDGNGDTLTAVLVTGPASGTLTLNADGSFTYTPNANFSGTDTFTYQASDGSLTSNVATVTITVTAVADAPVAGNDSYSTPAATVLNVPANGVLANDSDPDGTTPTAVAIAAGPTTAGGTVTLNADGSFTYTPPAGFVGTDTFTYQATDGALSSAPATVTISVGFVDEEQPAGFCVGMAGGGSGGWGPWPLFLTLAVLFGRRLMIRRFAATASAAILALAIPAAALAEDEPDPLSGLPRSLSLSQEPRPQEQPTPAPPQEQPVREEFASFGSPELGVRVGLAAFSDEFESDPQAAASVALRAPMPWLSRGLLGLAQDDFGGFVELTVSQIDRDLDFLDDEKGVIFFLSAGVDYTMHRDDTWMGLAQLGVAYGNFGGVDDTEDGAALLLGLQGGIQVAEGIWATVGPQALISDGDQVYLVHFGVNVQF
jgi:VCBS repeat-containing protein